MGVYHFAGQDIRTDLRTWYAQLTGAQILAFGLTLGKIVVVVVLAVVTFRAIRWGSALLEAFILNYLPRSVFAAPRRTDARLAQPQPEHQVNYEATVRRLVLHRRGVSR